MRTTDLPRPDLAPYAAEDVRFAIAAWPMRAAEELRSALIIRALARAARASGMPAPWPARFWSAVRDELRHSRLCAEVGARLGAARPTYDPRPVRARLTSLADPRERLAALLLVEVAMGETISMMLFAAGRRGAREPATRAALRAILRDEVRHQRLGWAALRALWPTLDDRRREALQREAARGLAGSERQVAAPAMQWLRAGKAFHPAYAALGVLHPERRIEAFYFAVERLVVPRLNALGLDGGRAWAERYRQPSQG
ncbi:MAG TPA: diiron oxygenase [Polyangiaceae bacterium]|jgi:hypothetical protein